MGSVRSGPTSTRNAPLLKAMVVGCIANLRPGSTPSRCTRNARRGHLAIWQSRNLAISDCGDRLPCLSIDERKPVLTTRHQIGELAKHVGVDPLGVREDGGFRLV